MLGSPGAAHWAVVRFCHLQDKQALSPTDPPELKRDAWAKEMGLKIPAQVGTAQAGQSGRQKPGGGARCQLHYFKFEEVASWMWSLLLTPGVHVCI